MKLSSVVGKFSVTPVPSPWSSGFWEALEQGFVAIQACQDCARLQHPPTVCCPGCGSFNLGYREVSGAGVIYSFTLCTHPVRNDLEPLVPYNVVLVELSEGVRVVSSLVDDPEVDIVSLIGRKVKIFALRGEDGSLPVCRLVDS